MDLSDLEHGRLAQLEQVRAGMREWTETLWAHYQECLIRGFSQPAALRLTEQFQVIVLTGPGSDGGYAPPDPED